MEFGGVPAGWGLGRGEPVVVDDGGGELEEETEEAGTHTSAR